MVGKQFSFFLAASDQREFERSIKESGDIVFLKVWPQSSEPEEIQSSIISKMGEEVLTILVTLRKEMNNIRFSKIENQNRFSCDFTTSPAIEFSRCYVTKDYIRAGRLYMVDKYWYNGRIFEKSPEFIEWSRCLYNLGKRSLKKLDRGYYAGAKALELRESGLAFEGIDTGKI